MDPLELPD